MSSTATKAQDKNEESTVNEPAGNTEKTEPKKESNIGKDIGIGAAALGGTAAVGGGAAALAHNRDNKDK